VVCADVDEPAAEGTAAEINELDGASALAVACDVSSLDAVAELAGAAEDWLGAPVDLVVNNAGVGSGGLPIGSIPIDDWRWTLGVNLWGVVHGCHVFAPRLRSAGRGGIVNVASAASFASAPCMGPYNTSKAAVLALSETLAAELRSAGVAVSVLCPTFVKTNIAKNGRIRGPSPRSVEQFMDRTGWPAPKIARVTLDAHDRGRLHILPQIDARVLWGAKRCAPSTYVRAMAVVNRRMTRSVGSHLPADEP
jgi:hypothetical protein